MLFTADAHAGLADGTITVTFRRWTRPQAKIGGLYTVGDSRLLVDDVRQVRVGDITDLDAQRAGVAGREAIVARLGAASRGRYGKRSSAAVDEDTMVWRVEFHRVAAEPKLADDDHLAPDDVAEITRRLDRLDAASQDGPWTAATLQLIATNPAVVSTTLAETMGRDRPAFKTDVRKLKRLGLTESLDVGYRLSPRGQAYLQATAKSGD